MILVITLFPSSVSQVELTHIGKCAVSFALRFHTILEFFHYTSKFRAVSKRVEVGIGNVPGPAMVSATIDYFSNRIRRDVFVVFQYKEVLLSEVQPRRDKLPAAFWTPQVPQGVTSEASPFPPGHHEKSGTVPSGPSPFLYGRQESVTSKNG